MPDPATPDFDALYRADPDPFRVATSWYEQRKIAVVLAALTRPRYRLAWDVAAGTGHLVAALAARCERLLATDASAVAVAGWQDLPDHVTAAHSALPDLPPAAHGADLVLVSEVLYYLDADQRAATVRMLAGLGAEIVAVTWRHHPHDAYASGAQVLAELDTALPAAGFSVAVRHEEPDFLLTGYLPAHPTPEAR